MAVSDMNLIRALVSQCRSYEHKPWRAAAAAAAAATAASRPKP